MAPELVDDALAVVLDAEGDEHVRSTERPVDSLGDRPLPNCKALAQMARGTMRSKIAVLEEA
jgi:hypothetical protein